MQEALIAVFSGKLLDWRKCRTILLRGSQWHDRKLPDSASSAGARGICR